MNIGFIGLGKLGLPAAEVLAQHHTVRGYDLEPINSDAVDVCDVKELIQLSDWIFIAVPTPHLPDYDGSSPTSHLPPRDFLHDAVQNCLVKINHYATSAKRVVLISTVLPGTVRQRLAGLLNKQHEFLYNPYLIAMGSVKWDMVNPEMIMIGTENGHETQAAQQLVSIYRPLLQNDPRVVIGTWEECEAIKIFYNTFISAKIALVNMIQDFAQRIGSMNVDVVTDALAASTQRIVSDRYMTAGLGDGGSCHPRDNIALRWLAQEHDLGYDLFDSIMEARECQARHLAEFLVDQSRRNGMLPVVIHGKSYKPDVPYCTGSYSMLVGHYVQKLGHQVFYVDPLADDQTSVVSDVSRAVVLMAHCRKITYGTAVEDTFYYTIRPGSIIVDPWRRLPVNMQDYKVIHYGNTRRS